MTRTDPLDPTMSGPTEPDTFPAAQSPTMSRPRVRVGSEPEGSRWGRTGEARPPPDRPDPPSAVRLDGARAQCPTHAPDI